MKSFTKKVLSHWKKHGRHDLPWRKTTDPYKIMVSEVMLQQTQVSRAVGKYKEFLKKFPTIRLLAKAPLSDVLKVWSGLGYNRRGKYLHDAAKVVVAKYAGTVPKEIAELRKLPGMGPYTASAVRTFAFNLPDILIETNIRAVFIHEFFAEKKLVHDEQIIPPAHEAAEGQDPRQWHWALMDYGAHLKKMHKNPARRSRHYVRQSKFEGSLRQVRGEILRRIMNKEHFEKGEKWELAVRGLVRDGMIVQKKGKWHIA